jgi:adenylate cyclase
MKIIQKIGFYFSLFSSIIVVVIFLLWSIYAEIIIHYNSFFDIFQYIIKDIQNNIHNFTWDKSFIVLLNYIVISFFVFVFSFSILYSLFYFVTHCKQIQERKLIQKAFQQYVGESVVNNILTRPESLVLGGKSAYLTAYFIDINNFSDLTTSYHPKKVVQYLNEYFTEMSDVIMKNDGTIDKYEGDAIMAFWGAPSPQDDHAILACKSALDHTETIAKIRKKWKKQGKPELFIKIGITSGEMIVGNIGSKGHFNYTVIGSAVNTCAQLEKLNTFYKTKILVSEKTYHKAKHDFEFREIGEAVFKGTKKPLRIFELFSHKKKLKPGERELIDKYHEALNAFNTKEYKLAKKYINHCLRIAPKDTPSKRLKEKIAQTKK